MQANLNKLIKWCSLTQYKRTPVSHVKCLRLLANQLVNFLRLLMTDGTDGPAAEADGTGETD